MNHSIWIYDIEIYSNYFSAIFKNPKSKELLKFIIFKDANDLDKLVTFIKDPRKWLIGYNNYSFDNQLLNFIYKNHFLLFQEDSDYVCSKIFEIAKNVINVREYSDYKYNTPFNSIDLMKVGGFFKSLKLLGVNLKWNKLQDLPISWDHSIQKSDLELMLKYNLNDVLITEQLYYKLLPQIEMRSKISKLYDVNVLSDSESGIANKLLDKFYSETTGLKVSDFKDLRTNRKIIFFNHVIFPNIKFKTKELNELLENIAIHKYFESLPFFKKSVVFDNIKYELGIGGLHSQDKGAIFLESDKESIIDADISSFYPSIIINHNISPAHLDKSFMKQYKILRDLRLESKHNKDNIVAGALKIVINSVYGKMKHKKHWLYDPLAAFQVTINGQLYLMMLIEKLVLNGFKVISANTDGIVTIVNKDKEDLYYNLCKEWEKETSFELEYNYYNKYIRKDVNNYIAITRSNKIKSKGVFVIPNVNSEDSREVLESLSKGFDKPIISIALYNYFVNNIKFEETIKNHTDIYDFCIAKKIDDKFNNEFHTIQDNKKVVDNLQKSIRFFISKDGGKLYKIGESTSIDYCVGKRVTILNNCEDTNSKNYNIDYDYYISETYKIFYQIKDPQLKLF